MWNLVEKVVVATATTLINKMNTSAEQNRTQWTTTISPQPGTNSSYHSSGDYFQSSSRSQRNDHTESRRENPSSGWKTYEKSKNTTCSYSCKSDKKKSDKTPSTTEKPKGKLGDNVCLIRLPKHAANASEINITIKQGNVEVQNASSTSAGQHNVSRQSGKNNMKGPQHSGLSGNSTQGNKSMGKNNTNGRRKNTEFKGQNSKRMNDNTDLSKSTWMYVGRLQLGTNKPILIDFLRGMFPGYYFKVESLPLYRDAVLPSFKVLVDNRILSEFKQLKNWPIGATIKVFDPNFKHN